MNINKHLRTNQSGFTLIELVVVIVILGILSITALPKFINIQSDANAVVIKAAIGSMKSAVSLFKVKTIVSGVTFETDVEFSGIKGSRYQPWAATATATGFSTDYSSPPEIFEGAGLNINDWAYRIYILGDTHAVAATLKSVLNKDEPTVIEIQATNCYFNYHWLSSGEPTFTTIITGC